MSPDPRRRVAQSAIRASRRSLPVGTIDLGLGEPCWEWPDEVHQAVAGALGARRRWSYGPHAGEESLRAQIACREGARPDEVLVTTGAQGALFALTRAYLCPGDVALVPDPGFPAYPELVRQAGGRPVPYALAEEEGFRLDPEHLLARLEDEPRARMVILNHPSNPTGAGAGRQALETVAAACQRRRVLLVSDEVYRDLHRPGEPRPVGLREVTPAGVVVSSLSKAWGAPGLRLGWLVGPPPVVEACRELHAWAVTSASSACQAMAMALLELGEAVPEGSRHELELRWRRAEEVWRDTVRRDTVGGALPKGGGLYLWLTLPAEAHADPVAFCGASAERLGVVGVPGLAFGERGRGFVRFALGGAPDQVAEGLRRWVRGVGARP